MAKGQLSPDNTTMSFAIPKKLKEELGVVATKENRSMSNLIIKKGAGISGLHSRLPGESGLVSRGSQGLRSPLESRRGSLFVVFGVYLLHYAAV